MISTQHTVISFDLSKYTSLKSATLIYDLPCIKPETNWRGFIINVSQSLLRYNPPIATCGENILSILFDLFQPLTNSYSCQGHRHKTKDRYQLPIRVERQHVPSARPLHTAQCTGYMNLEPFSMTSKLATLNIWIN